MVSHAGGAMTLEMGYSWRPYRDVLFNAAI
jgi:hypothetical protein